MQKEISNQEDSKLSLADKASHEVYMTEIHPGTSISTRFIVPTSSKIERPFATGNHAVTDSWSLMSPTNLKAWSFFSNRRLRSTLANWLLKKYKFWELIELNFIDFFSIDKKILFFRLAKPKCLRERKIIINLSLSREYNTSSKVELQI